MDNDNDFTFCRVGFSPDQERLEAQAVPNIGDLSIIDESSNGSRTNQTDNLLWKNNSVDKAPFKEETVGSLTFTVVDTPPSKQTTSSGVKDSVTGLEEQTTSTKRPKVRAKVPYEIGHSQMDWLKLTRTHPDLAGLKGESNKRLISMAEVKQNQREGSIWTVLKGRVYNITPYMKFHPGGVDMLMKGAGKDCTSLFNKYHAWVNAEFMLEKCLIGTLDDSR